MRSTGFLKLLVLLGALAAGAAGQITLSGTLPDGTEAAQYSGQITATGGTAPYHFSLALGSFLPVSLQLADNGAIAGTLNAFGTFTFFVQATDSSIPAQTATQQFSLIVHQMASTPLVFASTTLPTGMFGAPYSGQAQVTGGRPPYQIFAPQDELPLTMSFNFGQFVTGSLAVPPGTYQFHVTAEDSTVPQQVITSLFTFTVVPGLSVGGVFEPGTVLQPYSGQVIVSSGTAPYTFAVTSGALPQGMQLNTSTGEVTGAAMHPGNFTFGIGVTDSAQPQLTGRSTFTIAVAGLALSLNGPPPAAHLGQPYPPFTLSVTGGIAPYSFAFVNLGGSPPPGLTFNLATGVLSGTPTFAGSFGFELEATDSIGDTGFYNIFGTVLDLQPDTLPGGTTGTGYSQTFSPVGFPPTSQVTVTLLTGTLPPGFSLAPFGKTGLIALQGFTTVTSASNFTMRATDGQLVMDRSYTLTISPPVQTDPPLTIVPPVLPNGTLGQAYSQSLSTLNSTPPVTFGLAGPGTAPPGLNFSSSGTLTGTPAHLGSYGFDVTATDSKGKTATTGISVAILSPPFTVLPATIPNGTVNQQYSVTFAGSGGTPPYDYTMELQPIPGLFLDPVTGVLSGKPTSGGTYNFRVLVQDVGFGTGSRDYTLVIAGATQFFTINPPTLSNGVAGQYYNPTIEALGATTPVHWVITNGSLPPGVSMVDTSFQGFATIVGVLLTAGTYPFDVTATDGNNHSVTASYTVHVTDQIIKVSPDTVPAGVQSVPYSVDFGAAGGAPPYTFTTTDIFTGVSFIPFGLSISPDGKLRGAPLTAGQNLFRVTATDSQGVSGFHEYDLEVLGASLSLGPGNLSPGKIHQLYTATVTASLGTAPYTFSLTSGALPIGMTVTSAGSITGTPQQAGFFTFTVTARDSKGAVGFRNFFLSIDGDPITIGPSSLPDATPNQPYSAQFTASGGTGPYTFAMPSATLWSAGLHFASTGTITGTAPETAIVLSFTIQATDANGSTSSRDFQINVRSSGLSFAPGTLTSGIVGAAYSTTIQAFGGQAPYTFSLGAGSVLPSGMTLSAGGTLSGPPGSAGTYHFTVQAHDVNGVTGTLDYTFTVLGSSLTITTTSVPAVPLGALYTTMLQASGGTGPYTWMVTQGTLPAGLNLRSDGTLTGTATVAGAMQFTVTVTDQMGQTDSKNLSIAVSVAAPLIGSVSPNPVPGLNGSQTVFVNGSGFQNGLGLIVRITRPTGNTDLQGPQVTFLSASQLSILLDGGTVAANWTVQVINPDQQSSNVLSFAIAAAASTTSFALPQFVFGGAWYTALYFSNPTTIAQNITVNFIGDDGSPLDVPLAGIGTVSTRTISLNPRSTVILEALNGGGNSVEGWVDASLPTGVVGYAVFRQVVAGRADQEAVVPLTPESSQAADLTYDDTLFTTAVAFLNPTNQSETVTISAYAVDGSPLGSAQVILAPRSKQSASLKNLPGLAGIAGNRGRVVFSVSSGAVSVLGLRFGGSAFTSIPVSHRTDAPTTSTSFALPQFVFGGAWYSALYFSNTTNTAVSFPVNFIDDTSAPLSVALLGKGTDSSQTVNLDPGATAILEAPTGAGATSEGWANTTLPPGVVGYAVFRQSVQGRPDQEAVVPLTPESDQAADLVYDDTLFTTSVAFLNPSDQLVTVAIVTYTSGGVQNGTAQVALQPHSKKAVALKQQPGLEGIAGNRGWASFSVSNGAVSVLGLRFGGQAFTSIPVPHR